eukprot:11278297-Prorocentrum_lima.AAC.1
MPLAAEAATGPLGESLFIEVMPNGWPLVHLRPRRQAHIVRDEVPVESFKGEADGGSAFLAQDHEA